MGARIVTTASATPARLGPAPAADGEHTDVENATLNAAVSSGERVAAEIGCQI
ncbi:hypothetical protein ACIGFK_20460 [Streptomyces sp. NPDC085524]|uniref:hypothetical protein n=1 Tax=Streptomyces sp. NPDC085524 TaxID=3365728 RepID=UPI0037D52767